VLDLPQLYTKPPAESVLQALALLTLTPPSWESADIGDDDAAVQEPSRRKTEALQVNPEGVTRYLTSIVSSSLSWIEDEEAKEEIWNGASARLSERSGRTAMGAISRKFRVPSSTGHIELLIHEPALTGDDLGLKTWAASYLLAKRLHTFGLTDSTSLRRLQVLELGSGTGLVGLAMASLGADVVLSDLPSIHANLVRNITDNADRVRHNNGSVRSGILDWTEPESCRVFPADSTAIDQSGFRLDTKFPLILAADTLYSPKHPQLLVDTIAIWLSEDDDAKFILEIPLRDPYIPEISEFRRRMAAIGLCLLGEGEEKGYDDWGWTGSDQEDSEKGLVTCWWSCWGRTTLPTT
jgi:predicted nicotinamide N-methyase